MLGNLIGGLKINEPLFGVIQIETAESRLKSLRGQDRSVNIFFNIHARETANAFLLGKIYSPNSKYKKKLEITQNCHCNFSWCNISSNGRVSLMPIKDGNF
jgi:hypothetical protein